VGGFLLLAFLLYFAWWLVTFTGSTGELSPRSRARVFFPIWGNTAFHKTGYTWAKPGDTIVLDYDVKVEAGFLAIAVGKTRWPYRTLLRDEQRRAVRTSASGQLRYLVKHHGLHTIWAGRYSMWRGEAQVRWVVVRSGAAGR
jgi:hypothetical protein